MRKPEYGNPRQEGACSAPTLSRYEMRMSGPRLERIDLHGEVPRTPWGKLAGEGQGDSSTLRPAWRDAAGRGATSGQTGPYPRAEPDAEDMRALG